MWDREILYTYVTNFLKNKLLFIKNKEKNYTWFQNIRLYNVRVPSLSNHSFFTWLSNHSYSDKEEIQKTRKLLGQHQSVQRKGHCHLCGRKYKGKLFLCSHKKRVLKESSRMKEQYSTSPVQKKNSTSDLLRQPMNNKSREKSFLFLVKNFFPNSKGLQRIKCVCLTSNTPELP
jgi:hypothetical protein